MPAHYFVGIDIASQSFMVTVLDETLRVHLAAHEFVNAYQGFDTLVTWLRSGGVQPAETSVCMEATGVYGEELGQNKAMWWSPDSSWMLSVATGSSHVALLRRVIRLLALRTPLLPRARAVL